jgi:4-amino-4-deoxy-L-arabinose transferase-like glycosyltransferase
VREFRLSAALVFAAALTARMAAIWWLGDLPIARTPQLDSREYLLWAERLASGELAWPAYPEHAPGYSLFLGAVLAVSGGSLVTARVVQALLASLSCVLTARLAARALTPKAYLPAGLLQAFYGPFLYLDTALLAEPLLVFWLLLSVDIGSRAQHKRASWFLSGVALGAACIVRPTALVVFPALALAMQPRRRQYLGALALGVALVAAPVVIQNWRVTGVPLIQAYGGMNFYLGNTTSGDGAARARPGGRWDTLEAEASRAGVLRNAQDRYFMGRALLEMSSAPMAYLRVLANKVVWLTQQEELRDTHSLYFFRQYFPILGWLPGFGIIFALAVVGFFMAPSARAPQWVIWPLALASLTVILLVVGLRYRAPLVPFVIAFAAAGLVHLVAVVTSGTVRNRVLALSVLVVMIALAHLRVDAESRNLSEEFALTGLSLHQERDAAGAEAAYREALARDPQSSFAWDGLGSVLEARGRHAEARDAFERAVSANDSYALGWYHVATTRDRDVVPTERVRVIRTDTILALGLTLHREGRLAEAAPYLQKAAARGEGRAHFALALTAMQQRDIAAARRHAAEAVRLLPSYPPAGELWRAVSQ